MGLSGIKHPDFMEDESNYKKWRLTFEGGRPFVDSYLIKFSQREDDSDFKDRKSITYNPAFAKASILDVRNAIFQRISSVARKGGPESYQEAITGRAKGVDLRGSSMDAFIGNQILHEMLVMRKVGVWIDRQPMPESATRGFKADNPYLCVYKAEDIRSWTPSATGDPWDCQSVLLREKVLKINPELGVPDGTFERYRRAWIGSDGKVHIQFLLEGQKGETINDGAEIILNLDQIPFHTFEITVSLMQDICDYQIALLNAESADIGYILKANYPFYTEQRDPKGQNHLKQQPGTTTEVSKTDDEIEVGALHGRAYGKGLERPEFISPSTEPLKASMEKEKQMKEDIRTLLNLALSGVQPKHSSADSKQMDQIGLEAGLSAIGLVLEIGERNIAKIWAKYDSAEPAEITYPKRYSLKSDKDILDEIKQLEERSSAVPSETYKREVGKMIAATLLTGRVTEHVLDTILAEIDSATILVTNPDIVFHAAKEGIMSNKDAAKTLGIPEESVEQAKIDRTEREDQVAQTAIAVAASTKVAKE